MFPRYCFKIPSSITRLPLQYNRCNIKFLNISRSISDNLQNDGNIRSKTIGANNVNNPVQNNSVNNPKYYQVNSSFKLETQEKLLEKYVAALSSHIHQKNRVYKNDLLRVVNQVKEMNFSTKHQALLLLHCCTELLPDESLVARMNLAEQIWKILKPHTTFTTEHYNELLRVYISNGRAISVSAFIQHMTPMKPNSVTYELFLQALAEAGDLNQATEVIANMKNQDIPVTDKMINSLILCHGKSKNLHNIDEVFTVMKSLRLKKSIDTYTSMAKALAWNKRQEKMFEEMETAKKSGLQFQETHIMDIVKVLAAVGLYAAIPKALRFLPAETLNTPSISPYMQSVTTLLVYQNHPIPAFEIYNCLPIPSFGPNDDKGLHGRSLVRDCVKASLPAGVIAFITQSLMSSGRNPIALQNACEAALQQCKVPLALDLFTRMKQMGLPLRPHYFWPILIYNSKSYGEKGVMDILATMTTMEVKPDYDTLVIYTLPYVSFTSPQNLLKKFLEHGLSVSTVLTPMMEILLSTGQLKAACDLSAVYKGKIDAEKLIKPLLKGHLTSLDIASTVQVLQDICERASVKNKDWVGRFLVEFTKSPKFKEDVSDLKNLIQAFIDTKLRISTSVTDYCISRLREEFPPQVLKQFQNTLIAITDEHLVGDEDMLTHQITHPKNMNEESLHSHLKELEAKGMNTRGVLRRLLQHYCKTGNLEDAREILTKCRTEGIYLSAGMKASIFDLYVKLGELDLAEESLEDLNKTSPNFTLDEFKIIDFATLMVYRKKVKRAFEVITEQSKHRNIIGGRNIEANCWRLLDCMAAHGMTDLVKDMFDLLIRLGYCKPTNVILGPLIRVHLKTDDIEEAVSKFVQLAEQYQKTPLKHELLCKILIGMSDGQTEENFMFNEKANSRLSKLAQTVLNIDRQIHGVGDVQVTLIAALAEVGYKKTLRKLFLDPNMKVHPDAILRRCERFASEKKQAALEVIIECVKDLRIVDVDSIYEMMLNVYQREDDTQGALSLWYKMMENDMQPSQKFALNICALLKANNKSVPLEMESLLDKQSKNKIINK